jgi:hypothetical protein
MAQRLPTEFHARQRLAEINREVADLLRAFPELRRSRRPRKPRRSRRRHATSLSGGFSRAFTEIVASRQGDSGRAKRGNR